MSNEIPTYHLESSIFKDDNLFNNYKDITKERALEIEKLSDTFKNINYKNSKLDFYNTILKYLKSSICRYSINVNVKTPIFNSYDEVILFLILSVDRDLLTYKNSIFIGDKQKQILSTRKELGFYNKQLLKYERPLFLVDKDKFLTNIQADFKFHLSILLNFKYDLSIVSKERFDELKLLADAWKLNQNKDTLLNTWLYNMCYQKELLKFNNPSERIIFFICCIDPEYKQLKIFDNVSKINELKTQSINEFGFYNENFIALEKICHGLFNPEIPIYFWDEKKM